VFESAELNHHIDKATYDEDVPALREALLDAQYELLKAATFPLVVLVNGVASGGAIVSVVLRVAAAPGGAS